jgi:hypothetical protein
VGAVSTAVQYAGLVGKYIRMQRPATATEIRAGDPVTIGMDCLVARVSDAVREGSVRIVADYGMEFVVAPGEGWSFTIWPDEKTALELR